MLSWRYLEPIRPLCLNFAVGLDASERRLRRFDNYLAERHSGNTRSRCGLGVAKRTILGGGEGLDAAG